MEYNFGQIRFVDRGNLKMKSKLKVAFVVPWFGMNIPGGAESETRELAQKLNKSNVDVEILTTCAKEFASDWGKNYYSEGDYFEGDLVVRRFRVNKRNRELFDRINLKLINGISDLSYEEQRMFIDEMINSSSLYEYMQENEQSYDLFVCVSYMFGTTYYGAQVVPKKTIIIPCFHNEAYFHLDIFKQVYSNVAGIVYNALPEKELAEKNYPLNENIHQIVMGIGMDTSQSGEASRFRKKYNLNDEFILYAGRKDAGKNVDTLLQYFNEYKKRNNNNLKLVLIGGGEIDIPVECKTEVLDLGFVDIQDKYDAYEAATLLCQPSHNESFSLVIMESWLAKRPVLVSEDCAVTTNFAKESNGGLWFKDYFDFEGAINFYLNNIHDANQMGTNGKRYVMDNFAWDVIAKKYITYFEEVIK